MESCQIWGGQLLVGGDLQNVCIGCCVFFRSCLYGVPNLLHLNIKLLPGGPRPLTSHWHPFTEIWNISTFRIPFSWIPTLSVAYTHRWYLALSPCLHDGPARGVPSTMAWLQFLTATSSWKDFGNFRWHGRVLRTNRINRRSSLSNYWLLLFYG